MGQVLQICGEFVKSRVSCLGTIATQRPWYYGPTEDNAFYDLPYLNFRQDDTFLIRLVEAADKSSKSAQPGVRKK